MMSWALDWINGTSGRNMQTANAVGIDMDSVYWHRPLLTQDDAMGRDMPLFNDFLENSTMNEYWQRLHFTEEDFRGLDLPVLHVTGWFDGDQPGAMFYWDGMMAHSPAADRQYFLSGPWGHAETFVGGTLEVGDMTFKPQSIVDNKAEHLAFFDHYLKGTADSYDQPRARVYVMGAEEWREFDQYPPADAQPTDLYLSSGGRANSIVGDGALAWSARRATRHRTGSPSIRRDRCRMPWGSCPWARIGPRCNAVTMSWSTRARSSMKRWRSSARS